MFSPIVGGHYLYWPLELRIETLIHNWKLELENEYVKEYTKTKTIGKVGKPIIIKCKGIYPSVPMYMNFGLNLFKLCSLNHLKKFCKNSP